MKGRRIAAMKAAQDAERASGAIAGYSGKLRELAAATERLAAAIEARDWPAAEQAAGAWEALVVPAALAVMEAHAEVAVAVDLDRREAADAN